MLAEILPDGVVAVETVGDDPDARLLPEESFLVAKAVEKRRREVTNARSCARRALASLGLPEVAILRGPKGEPLWPDGVVGSMTHTTDYYAAAVASASKLRSVGVDAEVHGELPEGVLAHIAFGTELEQVAALDRTEIWWDRLLFSAKESVYKAWFPLTHRWLGFEDAVVTLDPAGHAFHARILIDGTTHDGPPLTSMSGRWLVRDGLVLTAITLPLA
jgi:4'-phosphopantetheinyl transferase EntD